MARRAVSVTAEPVPELLTPTNVLRTDRWPWLASLGAEDEDLWKGDPQAHPPLQTNIPFVVGWWFFFFF